MMYVYRNKETGETKRFQTKQEDLEAKENWELVLEAKDTQLKNFTKK